MKTFLTSDEPKQIIIQPRNNSYILGVCTRKYLLGFFSKNSHNKRIQNTKLLAPYLYMQIAFSSSFKKLSLMLLTGALERIPNTTVKMTCRLRFVINPGSNNTIVALVFRENTEYTQIMPITLPTMMWSWTESFSNNIPEREK